MIVLTPVLKRVARQLRFQFPRRGIPFHRRRNCNSSCEDFLKQLHTVQRANVTWLANDRSVRELSYPNNDDDNKKMEEFQSHCEYQQLMCIEQFTIHCYLSSVNILCKGGMMTTVATA